MKQQDQDNMKQQAAQQALQYISDDMIVGVGTGSTVNLFIQALAGMRSKIDATVASSEATKKLLQQHHIPVIDLNSANQVDVYIDGADEVILASKIMLKGGGGALTREKIVAAVARQFICLVDESKIVPQLGGFPLPLEVIPMARSYVARQLVKLGGDPVYREGFMTDNGNIILDVHNLIINQPLQLENTLNQITGIVAHGIFAKRPSDVVIAGTHAGVKIYP